MCVWVWKLKQSWKNKEMCSKLQRGQKMQNEMLQFPTSQKWIAQLSSVCQRISCIFRFSWHFSPFYLDFHCQIASIAAIYPNPDANQNNERNKKSQWRTMCWRWILIKNIEKVKNKMAETNAIKHSCWVEGSAEGAAAG